MKTKVVYNPFTGKIDFVSELSGSEIDPTVPDWAKQPDTPPAPGIEGVNYAVRESDWDS